MARIEVFADVCCPFTHVGLRRLVERREHLGREDVQVVVRSWPLELVNGTPLDPAHVADEVDALRAQVAGDLFTGFDARRFPASSLPAMDLAAQAYREDVALGERVSLALRDAVFERGIDIADPDRLAAIAAAAGIVVRPDPDHAAVLADWHEGQRRGVQGSPHVFAAGESAFCPSLDIERVDGEWSIHSHPDVFNAFLDRIPRG